MNIQEAADAALRCQDAVNSSGILFTFAKAMQAICDESNEKNHGTAWKNTHPVVILFLDKLVDLAGGRVEWGSVEQESSYAVWVFGNATAACEKLAKGEDHGSSVPAQ